MLLVILLVPVWFGRPAEPPDAEGVLGGARGGDGSPRASLAAPANSEATASEPQAVHAINFDEVRMGSGIGAEWVQTAGDA